MQLQMTEDQFPAWKEGNEWFWDYIGKIVEEHEASLETYKQALVECSDSDVEILRRRAVVVEARIGALQDILDLTYEGVSESYLEEAA